VLGFLPTAAGDVPRVETRLGARDRLGTALARLGAVRDDYKIVPGLYAVGHADPGSPVVVTANYKLSFDAVRAALEGADAWLLVLDTHGINVWCAAGKGTFGTEELVRRIGAAGLDKVVTHRVVIVPQLGAPGVCAREVRKRSGFAVRFGPVRAEDLRPWLERGGEVSEAERMVTFTLTERAVLVPVEFWLLGRMAPWVLLVAALLSGIGPGWFSFDAAWRRGLLAAAACAAGVLAGAGLTPLALPWLPGRALALKGAVAGAACGLALALWAGAGALGGAGLTLWATALGSYTGMNFTGSTPYTSPSGVEREMRVALPLQAGAVLLGAVAWVAAAFAGPGGMP